MAKFANTLEWQKLDKTKWSNFLYCLSGKIAWKGLFWCKLFVCIECLQKHRLIFGVHIHLWEGKKTPQTWKTRGEGPVKYSRNWCQIDLTRRIRLFSNVWIKKKKSHFVDLKNDARYFYLQIRNNDSLVRNIGAKSKAKYGNIKYYTQRYWNKNSILNQWKISEQKNNVCSKILIFSNRFLV